MADVQKQLERKHALWDARLSAYREYGDWGAFALATIQGSIEEINGLKESGRRLVATREGVYRNWDPDVLKVDEAAEGYIFDCLKRFAAVKPGGLSARVLSEEAGARTFGGGQAFLPATGGQAFLPAIVADKNVCAPDKNVCATGEQVVVISDPFDGSLLYKNDLGAFYFTTVAIYDAKGSHLATAVGDCVNRRVDFASGGADIPVCHHRRQECLRPVAITARYAKTSLLRIRKAKLSAVADLSKASLESYLMKPKYLYQEADDAYSFAETFKPLLSRVKFINANGGPSGFTDVAFGRMDVYLAHKQPLIDVFSGIGVARAAGAVITDFDGGEVGFSDDIDRRFYVVCSGNASLHEKVLEIIAEIKKATGYKWEKGKK